MDWEDVQETVCCIGTFSRPSSTVSSTYAARYDRISNGRFPNGLLSFFNSRLGLLSANETPKCVPTLLKNPTFRGWQLSGVVAALAKVSKCPIKPDRSSYPEYGSKRSLCFSETENAVMRLSAVIFPSKSLFPAAGSSSSPHLSLAWIQITRLKLCEDRISCVQYFLPSLYLSYAVLLLKLKPRLTTNPVMVSSKLEMPRSCTKRLIHVIMVLHPATQSSGTIIFGRMDPCMRMKVGHLECLLMSRGPEK